MLNLDGRIGCTGRSLTRKSYNGGVRLSGAWKKLLQNKSAGETPALHCSSNLATLFLFYLSLRLRLQPRRQLLRAGLPPLPSPFWFLRPSWRGLRRVSDAFLPATARCREAR